MTLDRKAYFARTKKKETIDDFIAKRDAARPQNKTANDTSASSSASGSVAETLNAQTATSKADLTNVQNQTAVQNKWDGNSSYTYNKAETAEAVQAAETAETVKAIDQTGSGLTSTPANDSLSSPASSGRDFASSSTTDNSYETRSASFRASGANTSSGSIGNSNTNTGFSTSSNSNLNTKNGVYTGSASELKLASEPEPDKPGAASGVKSTYSSNATATANTNTTTGVSSVKDADTSADSSVNSTARKNFMERYTGAQEGRIEGTVSFFSLKKLSGTVSDDEGKSYKFTANDLEGKFYVQIGMRVSFMPAMDNIPVPTLATDIRRVDWVPAGTQKKDRPKCPYCHSDMGIRYVGFPKEDILIAPGVGARSRVSRCASCGAPLPENFANIDAEIKNALDIAAVLKRTYSVTCYIGWIFNSSLTLAIAMYLKRVRFCSLEFQLGIALASVIAILIIKLCIMIYLRVRMPLLKGYLTQCAASVGFFYSDFGRSKIKYFTALADSLRSIKNTPLDAKVKLSVRSVLLSSAASQYQRATAGVSPVSILDIIPNLEITMEPIARTEYDSELGRIMRLSNSIEPGVFAWNVSLYEGFPVARRVKKPNDADAIFQGNFGGIYKRMNFSYVDSKGNRMSGASKRFMVRGVGQGFQAILVDLGKDGAQIKMLMPKYGLIKQFNIVHYVRRRNDPCLLNLASLPPGTPVAVIQLDDNGVMVVPDLDAISKDPALDEKIHVWMEISYMLMQLRTQLKMMLAFVMFAGVGVFALGAFINSKVLQSIIYAVYVLGTVACFGMVPYLYKEVSSYKTNFEDMYAELKRIYRNKLYVFGIFFMGLLFIGIPAMIYDMHF